MFSVSEEWALQRKCAKNVLICCCRPFSILNLHVQISFSCSCHRLRLSCERSALCCTLVLGFTQNIELLCIAKPGQCLAMPRLPFAGSHRHWKDDRIFIAGLAEAARRRGLAHGKHIWNHLESCGCMEKFVPHDLQSFPALLWFAGRRPGKKVSGARKQAAQDVKVRFDTRFATVCNCLQQSATLQL